MSTVYYSGKDEREISYVDESVVEGSEDACDAKNKVCESEISLKLNDYGLLQF